MNRSLSLVVFCGFYAGTLPAEELSYDCMCLSIETHVTDDASGEEFTDTNQFCSEANAQAGLIINFDSRTVRGEQTFNSDVVLAPVGDDAEPSEYSYGLSDADFKDGLAKALSEIGEDDEPSAFVASMANMAGAVFEHATVSLEGVLELESDGVILRHERLEMLMDMKAMMRGIPNPNGQSMGNLLTRINTTYRCATDLADLQGRYLSDDAGFPQTIAPFEREEAYLLSCAADPICGSYRYETEAGETGAVEVFEVDGAYYLHYSRDDGVEYIGVGLLSADHLAVTYFYEGGSDVGTTLYRVENGQLLGEWISVGGVGRPQWERLRKLGE